MWFEPISSWLVALLSTGIPWLNEKTTKSIPAEYWANKELHHKDIMDGVSAKEIVRRAEAGRYYIPKAVFEAYPVPHRNASNNKIIIENSTLYYEDVDQYGAYQAQQWVKQGKYNLNKEEMAVETLRINKKYGWSTNSDENNNGATIDNIDWHDTEAVRQWKAANAAERKYY